MSKSKFMQNLEAQNENTLQKICNEKGLKCITADKSGMIKAISNDYRAGPDKYKQYNWEGIRKQRSSKLKRKQAANLKQIKAKQKEKKSKSLQSKPLDLKAKKPSDQLKAKIMKAKRNAARKKKLQRLKAQNRAKKAAQAKKGRK